MSLHIVEVATKKHHKEFIHMPWRIFKDAPNWVPPLKLAEEDILNPKHPVYETMSMKRWLAIKDGEYVGRIAAIMNHAYNKFHGSNVGHFGYFDVINDQEIANALLQAAESELKKQGVSSIQGPVSPSTNYECGLLIDGFDDDPQIMMTYAHPYYLTLLETAGYTKAKDLYAYNIPIDTAIPEKIINVYERTKKNNNITCRPINLKNWDKEIESCKEIYNEAWETNWGFVPMTDKEFNHLAKGLKPILERELVQIIEVNKMPMGLILVLPDYNQVLKTIPSGKLCPFGLFKFLFGRKHITRARVPLLGIKKEFRHLGLTSFFFIEIKKAFEKLPQYKELEMSWILEDNKPMNAPLRLLGAKVYKTYRILEKSV